MGILDINNLSLKLDGIVVADKINISIEKGTIAALIGPNGAGKTSLFNVIAGIEKPDEGEVVFEGKNIIGLRPNQICKLGISRTFQAIKLFDNMSVLDNVMVGFHSRYDSSFFKDIFFRTKVQKIENLYKQKAKELLKLVGLSNKEKYQSTSLSYGQQRLLEICRSLASDPKLLLLDEPAAGMNENEKNELIKIIKYIKNTGVTILVVEHDMKFISDIADMVYVVNFGKNLASGDTKSVLNNQQVIDAYLGVDD